MCHHEKKDWLQNNYCSLNFKPLFYKRYIDDTFLLFTNEQHAHMFLQYLNNQHENITFTLDYCSLNFKPLFYKRYIDDTFLLFTNEQHAHMFLQYLNNQHENIIFTLECETNNALSFFLDVKVSRENNKFITSVFRKETFSGQGTSFF